MDIPSATLLLHDDKSTMDIPSATLLLHADKSTMDIPSATLLLHADEYYGYTNQKHTGPMHYVAYS